MNSIRFTTWISCTVLAATPGIAQQRLEPQATFPEPFSRIAGLREFADGRLIIADRLEQHVSYLDFRSGTMTKISREGQGPGEYRQPIGLLPFPDEGTLLTDIGNMRLSLINRDGRIGESWPMVLQDAGGGSGAVAITLIRPTGVDDSGLVYYGGVGAVMRTTGPGREAIQSDSGQVIRRNLRTGATDTIAYLYTEPATTSGGTMRIARGNGGSFDMAGMLRPFPMADEWGVAPDGRVAVVRANEYRVDWYNLDGSVRKGPGTSYNPVRIGRAEKNAWADRQSRSAVAIAMDGGRGGAGGGSFQIPRPNIDDIEFPDEMPPFGRGAVAIAPNGDVWVRLNQAASDNEPKFDIFDSAGQKIRQVGLPANREFVGFGREVLYAVAIDDDDLQWLERYPYPRR